MSTPESLTQVLVQYLAVRGEDPLAEAPPPVVAYMGSIHKPVGVSPNPGLPLYSLYEGEELPHLSKGFILDLILLRDIKRVSFQSLGRYFNVDPQEVEWFFRGKEESTAAHWAGNLSIDTDQDAEDYESISTELVNRWDACTTLGVSYVFWTYLVAQAMKALELGESHEFVELGLGDDLENLRETWDRNRRIARKWVASREPQKEGDNDSN